MTWVIYACQTTYSTEVAEIVWRRGETVARLVDNLESGPQPCALGATVAPAELTDEDLALATVIPLLTPGYRWSVASEARRVGVSSFPPLVDPTATIARTAELLSGVVVNAAAVVGGRTRLGEFVHVNRSASVGHDVEIAPFATVGPGCVLSGSVRVASRRVPGVGRGLRAARLDRHECRRGCRCRGRGRCRSVERRGREPGSGDQAGDRRLRRRRRSHRLSRVPAISVIVGTYNHEPFVEESLDSVRRQSFRDFELIVIDDCSSDGTVDRIRAWSARSDVPITLIVNETNRGICASRNRALARARGKYVSTLSGDDVYEPDKLERQYCAFESYDERVAVVYSDITEIDAHGREVITTRQATPRVPPEGEVFDDLVEQNFVRAPAVMVRRSALAEVGSYDESLAYEDDDMWLRLADRFEFRFCPGGSRASVT